MARRSRNTGSRTGNMAVRVNLDDSQMRKAIAAIQRRSPQEITLISETLAALGKEYARDIVTVLIYATPERSGYKRTRMLLRSIYSSVESLDAKTNGKLIRVGASAHYAAFNEFGTYDGWIGANAPQEILEQARAVQSDLIALEYGRPASGLEPRPFIIPALVMLERKMPELVMKAARRITGG